MTLDLATAEQLTVRADGATTFRTVLASLPMSFAPADVADVVVVGGDGWAARAVAAVRAGARGVVVSDPGPAAADDVRALADLADTTPVVLAEPYAGDPGLVSYSAELATLLADAAAVSVVATRADGVEEVLLAAVRTLRALGHVVDLSTVSVTAHGCTAAGTSQTGAAVSVLGALTRARAAGQTVRGYGFTRTVTLDLPGAATATPALIHVVDADGDRQLPTVYETADRAAWRQVHAALTRTDGALGEPPGATDRALPLGLADGTALRELAADLDRVRTALGASR